MPSPPDYASIVVLLGHRRGRVWPSVVLAVPLAEAVKAAVEECGANDLHDVYIAAPSGPIEGWEAVGAIYKRDDFPLLRAAGH